MSSIMNRNKSKRPSSIAKAAFVKKNSAALHSPIPRANQSYEFRRHPKIFHQSYHSEITHPQTTMLHVKKNSAALHKSFTF